MAHLQYISCPLLHMAVRVDRRLLLGTLESNRDECDIIALAIVQDNDLTQSTRKSFNAI
jgi:hypothetical protein